MPCNTPVQAQQITDLWRAQHVRDHHSYLWLRLQMATCSAVLSVVSASAASLQSPPSNVSLYLSLILGLMISAGICLNLQLCQCTCKHQAAPPEVTVMNSKHTSCRCLFVCLVPDLSAYVVTFSCTLRSSVLLYRVVF